jgi:hypothetical protein
MRIGIVAVAGLVVAAGAQAQQGSVNQAQLSQYVVTGSACPGQLQARQHATGGATVWTTALEDQKDPAQAKPNGLGVHVEFEGAKAAIKALELRVSYEPLGLKRVPVTPGTNGFAGSTPEREKNFNLDREAAMRLDADLLVGPAATITRVHLMSATFADGSVWQAPSLNACSVVPSRVVLVKSK